MRCAMRLIPVVTVLGLQVGIAAGRRDPHRNDLLPGPASAIGWWRAVQRRDYNVLQGGTLLIAILVMMVNLGVDVLYGVLNPRLRRR